MTVENIKECMYVYASKTKPDTRALLENLIMTCACSAHVVCKNNNMNAFDMYAFNIQF